MDRPISKWLLRTVPGSLREVYTVTLPSYMYGDPAKVYERKQSAIDNRIRDCRGCTRLSFDASGERIIAVCELKLKGGRRVEKCSMYKESQ